MPCPSDSHTEQATQGSQRGQTLRAPSPCTCFSLYLSSFLPGLSPWKLFQPLPPTHFSLSLLGVPPTRYAWLCHCSHPIAFSERVECSVSALEAVTGSRMAIVDLTSLVWSPSMDACGGKQGFPAHGLLVFVNKVSWKTQ